MTKTDGFRDMFGARAAAQKAADQTGHIHYYWQRPDGRWDYSSHLSDPNGKAVMPNYSRPDKF